MTLSNFYKYFIRFFVVLAGSYLLWNLNLFQPFSANYPPRSAYKTLPGNKPDSVLAAPGYQYHRGVLDGFLMGKHYRFIWSHPVKVPVLHLTDKNGGMKILRRGGGMQTTRFTLIDAAGKEYALRSVDKDPVSVLPSFLWPTIIGSFVRDQVSATDPFATLVVAELSRQAGIPFVAPELFFVLPGAAAFREFGFENGGFFYLSLKETDPELLQQPGEVFTGFISSEELFQLQQEKPETATVDSLFFLRCRLFDLFIGDWDRHPGQWEWAGFSASNHTVFRPVPKDRDQAFCYYQDGILPYLLTRRFALHKMTSLKPDFQDLESYTVNGRVLDGRFLKNFPQSVFEEQARLLQKQLTDAALQAAVSKYPAEIPAELPADRLRTLISRRNQLLEGARLFYEAIQQRNK